MLDGQSPLSGVAGVGLDAPPQPPWIRAGLAEGPILLQLFVRGNPFRGSAGGGEPWTAWIEQLLDQQRLAGVVVYGSPYLWQDLKQVLPADLPAAWSPAQMPEAQALVLDRLGLGPTKAQGGFTD